MPLNTNLVQHTCIARGGEKKESGLRASPEHTAAPVTVLVTGDPASETGGGGHQKNLHVSF